MQEQTCLMMFKTLVKNPNTILFAICILSLAMHWQYLQTDLVGAHVWRQTQTQTVINNFVEDGLNIFEPKRNDNSHTDRIYRMEFPLMQWLFALAQKYISPHIAVSRILSLLIGFCSLFGIYRLGKIVFKNTLMALAGAWAISFSPVFYYYTINPLPDNLALCVAIWSIVYYFSYFNSGKTGHLLLSSALLCIAALCKLPYILFGSIAIAHTLNIFKQKNGYVKTLTMAAIYVVMLLPAVAWYKWVIPSWDGNDVTKGLLATETYTLSSILNTLTGTIISTLPEMLLNYGAVVLFIYGLYLIIRKKLKGDPTIMAFVLLTIALSAYFIFEINMIALVHDYYLMPFLPLLFLVVAYGAGKLLSAQRKTVRYIAVVLLLTLPVFAALRINGRWGTEKPGFNSVYYHYKEELRAIIPESSYCVVGNDVSHSILLYYLDRKGWVFENDRLYDYDLRFYIFEGAEYLFSDSRIDEQEGIQQLIDSKVFEQGNLKVYKLKNKSAI